MFITAQALEKEIKANISKMNGDMPDTGKNSLTAGLCALGMFSLAGDSDASESALPASGGVSGSSRAPDGRNDLTARLCNAFGVELYGNIVIDELSHSTIEFECIYGLVDELTNKPGKEITFTVRDREKRFPVYLTPDNIDVYFSLNALGESESLPVSSRIKSCVHDKRNLLTSVVLEINISDEAFFSEGEFIMYIDIRPGGTVAAQQIVRFTVKNSFPTFFKENLGGSAIPNLVREKPAVIKKEIVHNKTIIQSRQKNVRITFDKRRGEGIPAVLCSNGAFKASMITRTSVNIIFKLSMYKSLERKLLSGGVHMRFPPETSVWVEWDDIVVIYNLQYKGFLMETGN